MTETPGAARSLRPGDGGFTLPEILIALAMIAIVGSIGMVSYREFRDSTSMARAVQLVSSDVTLARSLAIRGRTPVSLVSRDAAREYVIRDTTGTVFHRRRFDGNAQLQLDRLDVATPGDSLTFDGRGILTTVNPLIVTGRGTRTRSLTFNALGKSRVF